MCLPAALISPRHHIKRTGHRQAPVSAFEWVLMPVIIQFLLK